MIVEYTAYGMTHKYVSVVFAALQKSSLSHPQAICR